MSGEDRQEGSRLSPQVVSSVEAHHVGCLPPFGPTAATVCIRPRRISWRPQRERAEPGFHLQ